MVSGTGFLRFSRGRWLLLWNRGRGRREQGAVALDVTNLLAVSTRGRDPRVFDFDRDKRTIHASNFHFRREGDSSIYFHLNMSNTDARKA